MTISQILSELAIETNSNDIPGSSYDEAIKMLLDTLGCAYAGAQAPGVAELLGLERELSAPGKGTVFFSSDKLALPSAAFCNSAMIHAMDFDNNYPGADIHILSIVVPVAMACCEAKERSGQDFLAGMILGVEVAARIAKQYMKAKRRHNYFLTTSLVGGWGGVVTAARLFGVSVPQTVNAMGIYYAHTCGNRQALLEKTLTKRMQPAIAAKAALYSVLLAQKGFTGSEETFEGAGGFYRCYALDEPPAEDSFRAPADPYGIEELVVKHFPTCGIHHANILAALELKRKYGFQHSDIERVEFFLHKGANTLVSMPFDKNAIPQIAAQFCAPYAIALALVKGEVNIRDFRNDIIEKNTDVMALAKRTIERSSFADLQLADYRQAKSNCTYVKVCLRDGTVLEYEQERTAIIDPSTMRINDVEEKFTKCMSVYADADSGKASRIIDEVKGLMHAESIFSLVRLLS